MSFLKGFLKVASDNLAQDASEEARFSMQDYVKGSSLNESKDTAQAKGKAIATSENNKDNQRGRELRHVVVTSRGGRAG